MAAHTVFISHSHADNNVCDYYAATLVKAGIDVWYDRMNLDSGTRLSQEIQRELEMRSLFIVMLSPEALNSYWVQLETDAYRDSVALDNSRIILPIKIKSCEIPLLLRVYKWIDATSISHEQAIKDIVRLVNGDSRFKSTLTKHSTVKASVSNMKIKWQNLGTKFTVTLTISKEHTIVAQTHLSLPHTKIQLFVDNSPIEDFDLPYNINGFYREIKFKIDGIECIFSYGKFSYGRLALEIDKARVV